MINRFDKVVPAWFDFEMRGFKPSTKTIRGVPSPLTPIKAFRGRYLTVYSPLRTEEVQLISLVGGGKHQMLVGPIAAEALLPRYATSNYNELVGSPAPLEFSTLNEGEEFELIVENKSRRSIDFRARIHGITLSQYSR